MNVQTIEFDASTPIQKQITVPTNSDFAVGIKVYRDGKEVDVKRHELSVNGQIASDQRNGYNIFELSSNGDVGMTSLDVDVQSGIYGQVSNEKEQINTRPNIQNMVVRVYLSSFISEPTYFKATDIRWTELLTKYASSGAEYPDNWSELSATTGAVNAIITVYPDAGATSYFGLQENYPHYDVIGEQFRNKWRGYEDIPLDKILLYPNSDVYVQTSIGGRGKRQVKYTLTVDTHGVKGKFPLQVSQIDTGYIEKNTVAPFVYTSTTTTVAANELQAKYKGKPVTNVNMPDLETIGTNGMKDAFKDCKQLTTVDFSKLSAVGTDGLDGTFDGCTSLEIVLFQSSEAIPTITSTTFTNTNDTFKVIVPDALYEDWVAAENWSDLSSHITKVTDYVAVMTNYGGQDNMDNI